MKDQEQERIKSKGEIGQPIIGALKKSQKLPSNNHLNVVPDEITTTRAKARKFALNKIQQERVDYIREIFKYILINVDENDIKRNPFWYGDKFDFLYEKDLNNLKMTLTVYRGSKGKEYL